MKNYFFCVTFILATSLLQTIYGLYEHDYCTNSNGEKGTCKKAVDCKRLEEMLRTNKDRPKICGWQNDGISPIICCPPDEIKPNSVEPDKVKTKQTTRAESEMVTDRSKLVKLVRQKCVEYGKYVFEEIPDPVLALKGGVVVQDHCGRLAETMIVGGVKAKPREFPHMALIGYNDPAEYKCGGSLISEQFVISAAHCSKLSGKGSAKWAMLGELDTSTTSDDAYPEVYQIIQIINHPKYDPVTQSNDISLFKLDKKVEFHAYIRPLCLDTGSEIPPEFLTASGWGHLELSGVRSSSLMKVTMKYVSFDECHFNYTKKMGSSKKIPLVESMVCAGGENGKDACQGDSGGPLQVNLTEPYCMYDLVGITSFGKGCGLGYPGVYTRVSYYIPWIISHVWPDDV